MSLELIIVGTGGEVSLGQLAEDAKGTEQTVFAMFGVLYDSMRSPGVAAYAQRLAGTWGGDTASVQWPGWNGPDPQTLRARAESVFVALQRWQRFRPDPKRVERVNTPAKTIADIEANGGYLNGRFEGDCDDVAMLGIALLRALGLSPVLCVTGPVPRRAYRFSHILFGYRFAAGPLGPQTVALMDPQEKRAIGHWPKEGIIGIYEANGEHAA
jgi:hypothetical protein